MAGRAPRGAVAVWLVVACKAVPPASPVAWAVSPPDAVAAGPAPDSPPAAAPDSARAAAPGTYPRAWLDPCSSAAFFDGWRGHPRARPPADADPVAAPRTWLPRTGWRRAGPIATHEIPGSLTWVAGLGAVDGG